MEIYKNNSDIAAWEAQLSKSSLQETLPAIPFINFYIQVFFSIQGGLS
jgi:hypothetical protein